MASNQGEWNSKIAVVTACILLTLAFGIGFIYPLPAKCFRVKNSGTIVPIADCTCKCYTQRQSARGRCQRCFHFVIAKAGMEQNNTIPKNRKNL